MKKKIVFLLALSVILVTTITMHSTLAYLTTYAYAAGGYTVELGDKTSIEEDFSNWTKRVIVNNAEGSQPVFVRVQAFCGSKYTLLFADGDIQVKPKYEKDDKLPDHWLFGDDGFIYYGGIVYGGQSTTELLIRIENIPDNVTDGFGFNVAVVYETTPVLYDEDGNPYADWNVTLNSGSTAPREGGDD